MSFSGSRDSRRSSSARRRQARATRIFLLVGSLFALASFFGGYAWQAQKTKLRGAAAVGAADVATDPAARAEALDHIDEAIRAKHEKRTAGALSALKRARSADPSVPGIDVTLAEIALNEKQFIEMRAAAGAARKNGDYFAGASVLLGIDKWINRGSSEAEVSAAAAAASGYFGEATDSDYFYAPAWFFSSDALRYSGREGDGLRSAVAALHRFNPWESSDLISAKALFASAEGDQTVFGGLAFLFDSPWTRAVGRLTGARCAQLPALIESLSSFASVRSVEILSSDPFAHVGPHGPTQTQLLRAKDVSK